MTVFPPLRQVRSMSNSSIPTCYEAPLPAVHVRTPDGRISVLLPCDVIGRSPVAALRFDDPRVSEMHAYVSSRSGKLMLLGLRGRLGLGGKVHATIELTEGQSILLAPDLAIEVVSVAIPEMVLMLSGDDLVEQVVPGTCSVLLDPEPTLAPGARPGALMQLWPQDDGWRVRVDGTDGDVHDGQVWTFGDRRFRARWSTSTAPSVTETAEALGAPLRILAHYDTVHIYRGTRSVLRLTGKQARILSELVAMDGPAPWSVLAGEVWGRDRTPQQHRAVLDVTLTRLRKRLAAVGLRTNLVEADGCGNFELVLAPGDTVEGSV